MLPKGVLGLSVGQFYEAKKKKGKARLGSIIRNTFTVPDGYRQTSHCSLYRWVDVLIVGTCKGKDISGGGCKAKEGEVEELEGGGHGHGLGQALGVLVDKVATVDGVGCHGCLNG